MSGTLTMSFRFDAAYFFIRIAAIVGIYLALLCCFGLIRDCVDACKRRRRERSAREEARIWVTMNPMNPRNRSIVGFSFSCSE